VVDRTHGPGEHRLGLVTDRLLITNEHQLRALLNHYAAHYNHRRPHRALQLAPPRPDTRSQSRTAPRYAADPSSAA
jgi:transposase InsO family protein